MTNFFTVNHSEAKGGDFTPVPVGEYEIIVSKAEATTSKSSGNPMIKLQLTIRDDVPQEAQKRKLFDNIVFQDNMVWKIQQVYKAFGLTDGTTMNGIEDVVSNLLYKVARVKVKHETYQDKVQDRVDFYTQPQNPLVKPEGMADPFANNSGAIDLDDSDLPF